MTEKAPAEPFIVPECKAALNIVYQDEHLLAVVKPAGLLSVPGRHPANRDSVITRLEVDFPSARIVHRLDMDTSGLMLIPLSKLSLSRLARKFQERHIHKYYVADVLGEVTQPCGEIDLPLLTDWPNRPLQKVDHDKGKPALTYFWNDGKEHLSLSNTAENLKRGVSLTRLWLKPFTGRSHQLRVHCQQLGHPIAGCRFYSPRDSWQDYQRMHLHAARLILRHPITNQPLWLESAVPF